MKVADGGAGGTTISIAVYRSSFPIAKWDLNDQDFNLTKAEWAWSDRTAELPKDASPGSEVTWPESGKPADYAEPTRAGFKFAGWSTDKSASAGGFIDGASPKLTMPEGAPTSDPKEYTLYALWTPLEYSVIFELAKNPEDGNGPGSDASFALNWESADGVRTVISLGNGRFCVDGFTMKESDYDEATRTVGLPEPSRTGYRFLGWSEPDGQSLAIDNAAKDGFAMNPVRLTQINGTPVLTARWTSAFGVTAPLSITFGDYDKTGAPGNPWLGDKDQTAADDTTQTQQDKEGASEQEGYAKGGHAFFENTGWHEAIKLVGLTSERHASANQVLTSYDTSKASEAAVLGDGTEANPGERLLSLYPSADKSTGVHFRLSDSLDESALGSAFTMAPQGEEGAKLLITYGLNLSTDPTDGSANHGLVLPTNDYERKQIATVSYTFATANPESEAAHGHLVPDGKVADGIPPNESFYLIHNGEWWGRSKIKAAANHIAVEGTESRCASFYLDILDETAESIIAGTETKSPFMLKVGSTYCEVHLIDLRKDVLTTSRVVDGRIVTHAGMTFSFKEAYTKQPMNSRDTCAGGWNSSAMKTYLEKTFLPLLSADMQDAETGIARVTKVQQLCNTMTLQETKNSTVFLPSFIEVVQYNHPSGVPEYSSDKVIHYRFFSKGASLESKNPYAVKSYNGNPDHWWFRSAHYTDNTRFTYNSPIDGFVYFLASTKAGVVPIFCL